MRAEREGRGAREGKGQRGFIICFVSGGFFLETDF